MLQMVVLIVNDPDDCPAVLEAWEGLGVSGVTILETSGLGRYRHAGMRDDLPLMPSLQDLFEGGEVHHRTLFSVVEGDELVDKMIAAARQVIGNLQDEHTGFLFVLPVSRVVGMGKDRPYMQKK